MPRDTDGGRAQLLRDASGGKLYGAVLLHGTEENLKNETLQQIRQSVLTGGMAEMNEAVLVNPAADELISACETLPFLTEKRLVLVRDCASLTGRKEAEDELCEYMGRIPSTCVLVFVASGKVDTRKKLPKAIAKWGRVLLFEPLRGDALLEWVTAAFEKEGKRCTRATADFLTQVSGRDTSQLQGEVGKLCAYLGDRDTVERADIEAIASRTAEYAVFELVEAVVYTQQARAFLCLRQLLNDGTDELFILAMLLRQYRLLQQYLLLVSERTPRQNLAEAIGVQEFVLRRLENQARLTTGGVVRAAVNTCVDLEYAVKSGTVSAKGCASAALLKLFAIQKKEG